mmetsp:Transcript_5026/g.32012  ORF Transcript_5026/g.32012 Transcript_5026/m.32012 type:complete len:216 (+) Transcript_5026:4074-4721(+)
MDQVRFEPSGGFHFCRQVPGRGHELLTTGDVVGRTKDSTALCELEHVSLSADPEEGRAQAHQSPRRRLFPRSMHACVPLMHRCFVRRCWTWTIFSFELLRLGGSRTSGLSCCSRGGARYGPNSNVLVRNRTTMRHEAARRPKGTHDTDGPHHPRAIDVGLDKQEICGDATDVDPVGSGNDTTKDGREPPPDPSIPRRSPSTSKRSASSTCNRRRV